MRLNPSLLLVPGVPCRTLPIPRWVSLGPRWVNFGVEPFKCAGNPALLPANQRRPLGRSCPSEIDGPTARPLVAPRALLRRVAAPELATAVADACREVAGIAASASFLSGAPSARRAFL